MSIDHIKQLLSEQPSGEWLRGKPASYFPLLNSVSEIGQKSPYLTRQWNEAKTLLATLLDKNLITD